MKKATEKRGRDTDPGEVLLGILGVGGSGVSRPILQILTLFRTKNVIFHTRFQT